MKQSTLNFDYVAEYNIGGISTIELFNGLDHAGEVSAAFISEFKKLELNSSEIIIKINSSGGSVVHGLNIVTTILDCKIPTTSRIVGIAASMASVIALATDKTVILDYALYMAHNPFSPTGEAQSDQLSAFAGMLKVIYAKRLGMSEDDVEAFMNGDKGKDGTWYNATQAEKVFNFEVEATEVQKSLEENIPELGKTFASEEIANELQAIAANITIDTENEKIDNKQQADPLNDTEVTASATKKKEVSNNKNNSMNLDKISASLNITDATVEAIEARVEQIVSSNISLEKTLADKNLELVAVNTNLSGKDVELATVSAELETAKAESSEVFATVEGLNAKIAGYEAKELEAHTAKIEDMVNEAAEEGKITVEAKSTWIGLMTASFETASVALEGLSVASAKKVKLSEEVSASVEEKEKIVAAAVEEVTSTFKLPTMNGLMEEIRKNPKKNQA